MSETKEKSCDSAFDAFGGISIRHSGGRSVWKLDGRMASQRNYGIVWILACFDGSLIGGLWQVLVSVGIHGIITVLAFADVLAGNSSPLLALSYSASFAVSGVAFAVFMRSRNSGEKQTAKAGAVSAIMGATEPAMYALINLIKSGLHCVVPEARLGVRQQDFLEFQCMHMQEWE